MDIWKSENWKVFYSDKEVRTGLYTRFDNRNNRLEEPHITIATGAVGDFQKQCQKHGLDDTIFAILCTIAHELTHYYQWINNTRQGDTVIEHRKNEREAQKLGEKKVYQYLIDLGMSQLTETYYEWKEWDGDQS